MEKSYVILLNGPSSAGKSTLARATRAALDRPFWHIASDQFVEAGMLPPRRPHPPEFTWKEQRPHFFAAFHRCLPAILSAGNSLIVDHVIEFQEWMDELVDLLAPYDVFFVGVRCPLEELERRERERGDRAIGEARDHLAVVHSFGSYDFEVDSAARSAEENAAQIIAAWRRRASPSAFEQMRRARG